MRHIHSVLIVAVFGLLGVTNASATAIYQWHSTSPGSLVTAISGELVFTNAAYFSGSVNFDPSDPSTQYAGCPYLCRIINSPVISARLTLAFTDSGEVVPEPIYVEPGSESFVERQQEFFSTLTFNNDGTLTGSLFANDTHEEANASGTHYSWSVFNYLADYLVVDPCGESGCYAGDGYWQLARVTVPEPPVWPLFGLGVLGVLGLVSLRRTAH